MRRNGRHPCTVTSERLIEFGRKCLDVVAMEQLHFRAGSRAERFGELARFVDLFPEQLLESLVGGGRVRRRKEIVHMGVDEDQRPVFVRRHVEGRSVGPGDLVCDQKVGDTLQIIMRSDREHETNISLELRLGRGQQC